MNRYLYVKYTIRIPTKLYYTFCCDFSRFSCSFTTIKHSFSSSVWRLSLAVPNTGASAMGGLVTPREFEGKVGVQLFCWYFGIFWGQTYVFVFLWFLKIWAAYDWSKQRLRDAGRYFFFAAANFLVKQYLDEVSWAHDWIFISFQANELKFVRLAAIKNHPP